MQTNAKFTFDDDYKTSFSGTIGGGKRTGVSTGIEYNQKIDDETYFKGFAGYDKSNGANASFFYEHRFQINFNKSPPLIQNSSFSILLQKCDYLFK